MNWFKYIPHNRMIYNALAYLHIASSVLTIRSTSIPANLFQFLVSSPRLRWCFNCRGAATFICMAIVMPFAAPFAFLSAFRNLCEIAAPEGCVNSRRLFMYTFCVFHSPLLFIFQSEIIIIIIVKLTKSTCTHWKCCISLSLAMQSMHLFRGCSFIKLQ